MATVNSGTLRADRVLAFGDFLEQVYFSWVKEHKRPSTAKGYRDTRSPEMNAEPAIR